MWKYEYDHDHDNVNGKFDLVSESSNCGLLLKELEVSRPLSQRK